MAERQFDRPRISLFVRVRSGFRFPLGEELTQTDRQTDRIRNSVD